MAESKSDTAAVATLMKQGKVALANKNYKDALLVLTRVIRACPSCQKFSGLRCSCRDISKAAGAVSGATLAHELLRKCEASCPAISAPPAAIRCGENSHLSALDMRTFALEALGEWDRATHQAERLLLLAPDRLEGYLRLGHVATMQGREAVARNVIAEGLRIGSQPGMGENPRVAKLMELQGRLRMLCAKSDPLKMLPTELVDTIFGLLITPELVCTRVCKSWRKYFLSGSRAWRHLNFAPRRRLPPPAVLRWLGSVGRDVATKMTIQHGSEQTCPRGAYMPLLHAAGRLTSLSLAFRLKKHVWAEPFKFEGLHGNAFTSLTTLLLIGVDGRLLAQLCKRAAPVLKNLGTDAVLSEAVTDSLPLMENLEVLKLLPNYLPALEKDWDNRARIAQLTPNLKCFISRRRKHQLLAHNPDARLPWPKLECLCVSYCHQFPSVHNPQIIPCLPESLRAIGGEIDSSHRSFFFAFVSECPIRPAPEWLSRLEHFTFVYRHSFQNLRILIEPGLRSGTLAELAIPYLGAYIEVADMDRLMAGAECLRCLYLPEMHIGDRDDWDRLTAFINSFPNLEVLQISDTEPVDGHRLHMCVLLERIMRAGKVKKIAQDVCTGVDWVKLNKIASEVGVRLTKKIEPVSSLSEMYYLSSDAKRLARRHDDGKPVAADQNSVAV